MNENQHTEASSRDKSSSKIAWLPVRALAGLVGVLGVSSLLYGIGFLAFRSHYTFWGIWSGLPYGSTELVEEGGRFLFHLFFVLLDLLNPASPSGSIWFTSFILCAIALISVPRRAIESLPKRGIWITDAALIGFQVIACIAIVVVGWFLLEAMAVLLKPRGILDHLPCFSASLKQVILFPQDAYLDVAQKILLLLVILAMTLRAQRLRSSTLTNFAIAGPALVMVAVVSLLPAIYGRLIHTADYPTVQINAESTAEEHVLIRATDTHWVLWNFHKIRTEVIRHADHEVLIIGSKRPLLQTEELGEKMEKWNNESAKSRCP